MAVCCHTRFVNNQTMVDWEDNPGVKAAAEFARANRDRLSSWASNAPARYVRRAPRKAGVDRYRCSTARLTK
jgi:hypothetical protein